MAGSVRQSVKIIFNKEIDAIIVKMPELITIKELQIWREAFFECLAQYSSSKKVAVLLDTNNHDFESIECLKLLRQILSDGQEIGEGISRIAFVQPKQCKEPGIASKTEAYFSKTEDAIEWINQ